MKPLLLKGLALGFVLAAAVGPMWLPCLRRTLASWWTVLALGASHMRGINIVSGLVILGFALWQPARLSP